MMGICALSSFAQETTLTNAGSVPVTEEFATAPKKTKTTDATKERNFKGFNVSLQGGMLFSMNENSWTYYNDNRSNRPAELAAARKALGYKKSDILTPQGSVSVGYDFGHALGVRVQANFAQNASAANHKEQTVAAFYPYSFNTVSTFADVVFNISGFINPEKQHLLETKIYAGAGAGIGLSADTSNLPDHMDGGYPYTVEMTDTFGFRAGLIEEVYINKHIGAFVDVNLEAYTDKFNGVVSWTTPEDESFPYDLRIVGSFGLIWHF